MMLLRAGDIHIDLEYQRHLNEQRAQAMAKAFDWNLAMMLGVNERTLGNYWAFDGQHRLRAIRIAFGDDERVACYVTHSLSVKDEARLFYMLQTTRRPLHPVERFRAQLVAGDKRAMRINDIVERAGFHVTSAGRHASAEPGRYISAISALENIDRQYAAGHLEATLRVVSDAWNHMASPKGHTLSAIAHVLYIGSLHRQFNAQRFISILRGDSPDGWTVKARGMQRLMGGAITSWVPAVMICEYNYKLQKSRQLPQTTAGFSVDPNDEDDE